MTTLAMVSIVSCSLSLQKKKRKIRPQTHFFKTLSISWGMFRKRAPAPLLTQLLISTPSIGNRLQSDSSPTKGASRTHLAANQSIGLSRQRPFCAQQIKFRHSKTFGREKSTPMLTLILETIGEYIFNINAYLIYIH